MVRWRFHHEIFQRMSVINELVKHIGTIGSYSLTLFLSLFLLRLKLETTIYCQFSWISDVYGVPTDTVERVTTNLKVTRQFTNLLMRKMRPTPDI